mgnify:CR=1 FL=1
MCCMSVELNLGLLGNALARLQESLDFPASQPLVVDASIQRFEFCIELTWKTLKKALTVEGISANTPRECLQQAYIAHWLDDEGEWLSRLKDRNLALHPYKEEVAWDIKILIPS